MSDAAADRVWVVDGPITIQNVTTVLAAGAAELRSGAGVVDLARVTDVDSSAVSLLLEWLRGARADGRELRFSNLPTSLVSLADVYGVLELIPTR